MNPRIPTAAFVTPGGADVRVIESPVGFWHRHALPGSVPWREAKAAIDAAVSALGPLSGALHVYASAPYALAACLGNAVLNVPKVTHHFHQADDDGWTDFGPAGTAGVDPSPLLTTRRLDTVRARHALVCEITWPVNLDELEHGLKSAGCPDASIEIIGLPPGHRALPDRAAVDRAARDLRGSIEQALRRPGLRELHLFYIGPAALLMRVAGRFHQPSARLVIHERGPGNVFRPAVAFAGGYAELVEVGLA